MLIEKYVYSYSSTTDSFLGSYFYRNCYLAIPLQNLSILKHLLKLCFLLLFYFILCVFYYALWMAFFPVSFYNILILEEMFLPLLNRISWNFHLHVRVGYRKKGPKRLLLQLQLFCYSAHESFFFFNDLS